MVLKTPSPSLVRVFQSGKGCLPIDFDHCAPCPICGASNLIWLKKNKQPPNLAVPFVLLLFLTTSSIQFSPVAQSCPTLCDPMNHSTPGLPVHHQLPEFTQTHVHRVSDAIQPSHPLSSLSPPALNLSQHQGLFHIRWPKYWSLSFSISPSNEHPGTISFRMDWLDLLAVQGTWW